ncbi:MAG: helix-turn-helix domain-containing protein [Anaerolineales bacterium]
MADDKGLLTAKEAVAYLGISLSTLHKIEKKGLIVPYRTPGGHRRYDRTMLDEYLEATRIGPSNGKKGASD